MRGIKLNPVRLGLRRPGSGPVPSYRYDPTIGDPRDPYTPVDFRRTRDHRPEISAVFVARVEGETLISTLGGRRAVHWTAEPGTRCVILGWWSDGTVHLKWPAIRQHYTVDGRFPAWVVAEDPDGRGHILAAASPALPAVGVIARAAPLLVTLLALIGLVVIVLALTGRL